MKTLWLLRHAKSSWSDATLDDHERPLNNRGQKAAEAVGKFMNRTKLRPEMVLCSTALRARQTIEIISDLAAFDLEVHYRPSLYLCGRRCLIEHITALAETLSAVMMVGHNPGFEDLLAYLSGTENFMPTAAFAEMKFAADNWQEVKNRRSGNLQWFITPKDL